MAIVHYFLGVALCWAGNSSVHVAATTMEELEALGRKKAWSEMVFLAKDVPVSDRSKRWEGLVEQAAVGHLNTLATEVGADLDKTATALLDEFPSLRRSKKFLAKRAATSLVSLRKCYDNPFLSDECGDRLLALAKSDSADYTLVREAAALVSERESPAEAVPFLKLALTRANRDKLCREDLWQKALLDGMKADDAADRKTAQEMASQECWTVMKDKIGAELDRSPSSVAGWCEVLKNRNLLKGDRAKKCEPPPAQPSKDDRKP